MSQEIVAADSSIPPHIRLIQSSDDPWLACPPEWAWKNRHHGPASIDQAPELPIPKSDRKEIERLASVASARGINQIVLVHGTFVGGDAIGIWRGLSQWIPQLREPLAEKTKQWLDSKIGHLGNYDDAYSARLQWLTSIANDIPVSRFRWSGENHHLGRVDAMIRFLDQVLLPRAQRAASNNQRLLVWAHSHGGNVMAMATQLMTSDRSIRKEFFQKVRSGDRESEGGRTDRDSWDRVARWLLSREMRIPPMDIVTFGMPARYAFFCHEATGGRSIQDAISLTHFIHHRPLDPRNPEKGILPRSLEDLRNVRGGDYVQQFGLTGTDLKPSPLAPRDWKADRSSAKHFEPGGGIRNGLNRARDGQRVCPEGRTLLVDYPADEHGEYRKVLGHAIYTHPMYIPFHWRCALDALADPPIVAESEP